jgi:phage terminase large subunit-like protein
VATKTDDRLDLELEPTQSKADLDRVPLEAMLEAVDTYRRLGYRVRFSASKAIRALLIFEELLVHTKGRWARKRFRLAWWQWERIVCPLFGLQLYDEESETWVRLYRLLWLEIARKNGKSELLAAIAIILIAADDEESAEVYGAAKDRDQATLVFRVAGRMLELAELAGPGKPFRVYWHNKRIVYTPTASYYQVIASDAMGNLGQDPHGIIVDEVLAQPDATLWDALRTGFGARLQPLMVGATTAGDDPLGFAFAEHEFSAKVAADPSLDPRRLVVIYSVPDKIDGKPTNPFDESLWPLAAPALQPERGSDPEAFLSRQVYRDEALVARSEERKMRAFVMFRLNRWLDDQGVSGWLGLDEWDASAGMVDSASLSDLAGRKVIGGLDLSSTSDTTSVAWTARDGEDGYVTRWRFWLPEARMGDLLRRTAGRADEWVKADRLRLTEGDVIDYDQVYRDLEDDLKLLDCEEIAFDRWGAANLVQRLQALVGEDNVVRIGQGYRDLSPGAKELERAVRRKVYRHGGDPVARWQIANVMLRSDEAENIKPDRKRSRDKIDGIVAAIMAVARWLDRPVVRSRRAASF